MDLRVTLPDAAKAVAVIVTVACVVLVASRAASAPRPEATPAATPQQRAMFALSVFGEEDGWRTQAEKDFPGDQWSQRDAFHGHEAQSVRDLAGNSHVSYEDVIKAIDDDVHKSRGQERSARAIPCKPRPFYD